MHKLLAVLLVMAATQVEADASKTDFEKNSETFITLMEKKTQNNVQTEELRLVARRALVDSIRNPEDARRKLLAGIAALEYAHLLGGSLGERFKLDAMSMIEHALLNSPEAYTDQPFSTFYERYAKVLHNCSLNDSTLVCVQPG